MQIGERVALAVDWRWGDGYLRAGLAGVVVAQDRRRCLLVMLDCFTADTAPQEIEAELLKARIREQSIRRTD